MDMTFTFDMVVVLLSIAYTLHADAVGSLGTHIGQYDYAYIGKSDYVYTGQSGYVFKCYKLLHAQPKSGTRSEGHWLQLVHSKEKT